MPPHVGLARLRGILDRGECHGRVGNDRGLSPSHVDLCSLHIVSDLTMLQCKMPATHNARTAHAIEVVSSAVVRSTCWTHDMLQWKVLLGQLLQANNDVLLWYFSPAFRWHKGCTSALVFAVVENAQRGSFDVDSISCFDELLRDCRCDCRTMLKRLGLRADVQDCSRHVVNVP